METGGNVGKGQGFFYPGKPLTVIRNTYESK